MKQGVDPIDGQTGDCSIGRNSWLAEYITWPFSGLYLYRDELVLSMPFRRYRFPRDQISCIHRYRYALMRGLQIEHSVANYPSFVVFFPSDVTEMEEALDENAFPLATPVV